MHKIDIGKAEKWPDPHRRNIGTPRHIDLPCPHCGKPTFGIQLNWKIHTRPAVSEITCAGCEKRISYFMTNAPVGCKSPQESNTVIYQDF